MGLTQAIEIIKEYNKMKDRAIGTTGISRSRSVCFLQTLQSGLSSDVANISARGPTIVQAPLYIFLQSFFKTAAM